MKLAKYLEDHSLSHRAFAEMIGVSQVAAWRYAEGKRFPEKHILQKIFSVTGGAVTANDFADLPAETDAA